MRKKKKYDGEQPTDVWACPLRLHRLQASVCGSLQVRYGLKCRKLKCSHFEDPIAIKAYSEYLLLRS
jgi:hypothetical protein